MTRTPRLSVGLPVYNGAEHLAGSLEAILSQSYTDFELVIADNASTDGTADVCNRYAADDDRIRYVRHRSNVGGAANHTFCVDEARAERFKWASDSDLWDPKLFELCMEALDRRPEVVLASCWTILMDEDGSRPTPQAYDLNTSSPLPAERLRSLLFEEGGDDIYGIIRTPVIRQAMPYRSHHHADRTFVARLCLYGPFYQVPDWLYTRRWHPKRSVRAGCRNLDARRASRVRHPSLRLHGEYVWGYVDAIRRSPLPAADKTDCYRALAQFVIDRAQRAAGGRSVPAVVQPRT